VKRFSEILGAVLFLVLPIASHGFGCTGGGGTEPADGGSSSSGGSGSSSGDSGSSSGSSSGSGGSSGSSSSGGDGGCVDDACCLAQKHCIDCCRMIHPAGAHKFVQLVQACDCGDAGPCATRCAQEYCKDGSYTSNDDDCSHCIQDALAPATAPDSSAGTCHDVVAQSCGLDPDCLAFAECILPQGNTCPL
jgi:hypothetical protein